MPASETVSFLRDTDANSLIGAFAVQMLYM